MEGSTDATSAHADMSKGLEKSEATSTRSAKNLSEKQKIIQ